MVFGQPQQDGIVQNTAISIGDQDVFALPNRHFRKVAWGQHLHEARGIGPGNLDLSFDGDIAQDRIIHEVPEILFRVTEIARNIHVVVDRKPLCAPAHRCIEIGRFTDLRSKAELICVHSCHPRLPRGFSPGTCLKL